MGVKVRTADLARELGILPSRVGFYAKTGLLKPVDKTSGGHHLFDLEESKRRFAKIVELRQKRYRLDEIKEKLK